MGGCFFAQRLASVSRAVTTEGTPYNTERQTGGEESEKYNLMSTTNRLKRKVSFAQRR